VGAVLCIVAFRGYGRGVRLLREVEGGVRVPRELDRFGCRRTAMRPGMAQGVQDAHPKEEQDEQYESQSDVDRLHPAAHPTLSLRPAASPYR
jgi:hypothetical protein